MSSTVIDAKLRISAEDRTSAEIAKVVNGLKSVGAASKVSADVEKLTRSLLEEERALKAVSAAASAQSGLTRMQADLQHVQTTLATTAKAFDQARQARAAFDGVRAAKESEQAAQIAAAGKAVREAGAAYRSAENDVRKANAAIAAQTTTVQQAVRAVAAAGRDVTNLATAEQTLRTQVERATSAVLRQIQVEDQVARAAQASAVAQKEAAAAAARAKEQALRDTVRSAERAARDQGRIAREEARDLRTQRAADAREQRAEAAQTARQQMRWAVEAGRVERQERIRSEQDMRRHHAMEAAEYDRHMRRHGIIGNVAAAATGAAGVHSVLHVERHALKAGAEIQSERVKLVKAGVPEAERQHIEAESLNQATKVKNVTQAGVMELWKEVRSVMTDPHEVDHVIGPLVQAKSLLDAQDPSGQKSGQLKLLVKGSESIGTAKDPERFNKLLDGYLKGMQVMGDTITPESIYLMNKYSKAAGSRWSDRFLMTTAQSLAQEMDGNTAGQSIQAAQKLIAGGLQNQHSRARGWAQIGLIDEKNLDYLKTGEVKGVKPGVKHAIAGDTIAAHDLDTWVYDVLQKKLVEHGYKSQDDQLGWVMKNMPEMMANVVSKLIVQRESFEAHAKMYGKASGLDGQKYNRDDATSALGAVTRSLETFAGVVTSPIMRDAAHVLDSVAGQIGRWSMSLEEFNKAHPTIAKAEAPAAGAIGLAGAGATSVAIWKLFNGGFGLKGSAAALDASAAALTTAAARLGGGLPDGGPGGPGSDAGKSKGGKVKAAFKAGAGIVGALGLEPLARLAQEHHIFEGPDLERDGWVRSGLDFLDPNFGNKVLGDRSRVIPSIAIRPGDAPLTIDRGSAAFGLNGPLDPRALPPALPPRAHPKMIDAEAVEREATEAGQKAGDAFGKDIVNAPLPPARSADLARTPDQILRKPAPSMTMPDETAPMTLGKDAARFGIGLGPDAFQAKAAGAAASDALETGFLDRLRAARAARGEDLPGFGADLGTVAAAKGTEAGQKAGQGVADGVKEKAPEVVEQGQTMFERLKAAFIEGIKIPISFTPGEGMGGGAGGGGIQKASFDPDAAGGFGGKPEGGPRGGSNAFGGSISRGGSLDGAGSAGTRTASLPDTGGGGAASVAGSAQDRAHRVMDRLIDRGWTREASAVAAGNAVQESGARSDGPLGDTRRFGRGDEAAHGLFQWRGSRYRALRAFAEERGRSWKDFDTQVDFFDEERRRRGGLQAGMHGLTDQTLVNRGMKGFEVYGDDSFGTRLGNARGLLRSYRPRDQRVPSAADRPPPGPKVPEGQPDPLDRTLPPGGFGGRGDMQAVALDLREAVDGLRTAGWRSHHTVEVTAGPGTRARTTGMRATSSGPVQADVGVSMPQTKGVSWDI